MRGQLRRTCVLVAVLGATMPSAAQSLGPAEIVGDILTLFPEDVPSVYTFGFGNFKPLPDGTVLLTASSSGLNVELWRLDPADRRIELVKDLFPGGFSGLVQPFDAVMPSAAPETLPILLEAGGSIFFAARTFWTVGGELWRSDGTRRGTVQVSDLSGAELRLQAPPVAVGHRIYFLARGDTVGTLLYYHDAVSRETVRLFDFSTGAEPSKLNQLVAFDDQVIVAGSSSEEPVWVSDGTAEGTRVLPALPHDARLFREIDGKLYFRGTTAESGMEPWVTDLTEQGTYMLADLNPGPAGSGWGSPHWIVPAANKIFLLGSDGIRSDSDVYVTEGTPATTEHVARLNDGVHWLYGRGIFSFGDFALIPGGENLFRVDGQNVSHIEGVQVRGRLFPEMYPLANRGIGFLHRVGP